jgi:hypothetical protein
MDTSPDFMAYEAKSSTFAALRAQIFPDNKRMLFEVLASAGIDTVVVEFDGCGDSGQIESVSGFTADNKKIALPSAPVEMREAVFDDLTISLANRTPHEIIEAMAYDFLEQTHSGWEDGDGAVPRRRLCLPRRWISRSTASAGVSARHSNPCSIKKQRRCVRS